MLVVKEEASSLIIKVDVSTWFNQQKTGKEDSLQRLKADTLKILFVGIYVGKPAKERSTTIISITRILALEGQVVAHVCSVGCGNLLNNWQID